MTIRAATRTAALALAAAGLVLAAPAAHADRHARPVLRTQIPGGLPRHFRFQYADRFHGWPVAPVHTQHPIRGAFLDPRGRDDSGLAGYHFGVDINVDDRHPDPGAPPGFSHRVYALEGGWAIPRAVDTTVPCSDRRLLVGHFSYWHVSPIVRLWQRITPGQQIGWTCRGQWHVHVSEWAKVGGARVWVNPLHRNGKIAPYVDRATPVVRALRFFAGPMQSWRPTASLTASDTARRLSPIHLHGLVELRALVEGRQSFWGFIASHPAWQTPEHPYRVAVEIRSVQTGALVLGRISFQSDRLPQTPYLVHYAPGTVQNGSMAECLSLPPGSRCGGAYWFRPFSRFTHEYWNTRRVRDGAYRVTVYAWDIAGNMTSRTVRVAVANL